VKDLGLDWTDIKEQLSQIDGLNLDAMEDFFREGFREKGLHFYRIGYGRDEVIMAKGVRSDYAAIHVVSWSSRMFP
jgi:hypothetical protein